ncbi:MAG: hypothetical protein MHM6MM_007877 [Cercozoa sp. M6MM]
MGICGSQRQSDDTQPQGSQEPKGEQQAHRVSNRESRASSGANKTADVKQHEKKLKSVWDRYEFVRQLGTGGSCEVNLVKQLESGDEFALKLMKKHEKSNKQLFQHEVSILSQLQHKNIIKLVDDLEDRDNFVVVTELCRGGELFDRIVECHHFSEKMASSLVRSMLQALDYCHSRSIVHRDLKPENFVFESKTEDSPLVLIDFGCAKVVDDDKDYGDLVGTPFYLAPESARDFVERRQHGKHARSKRSGAVLKASDLWSIGVICYVMVTGRPPFWGKSNMAIFQSILAGQVRFHPNKDRQLSDDVRDFIKQLLKLNPEERISIKEALAHPWIAGDAQATEALGADMLDELRNFQRSCKLKKMLAQQLVVEMTEEETQHLRKAFDAVDTNGDGQLQRHEIISMLMSPSVGLGEIEAGQRADEVFAEVDIDGDGEITFDEFKLSKARRALESDVSKMRRLFDRLDKDHSGSISLDEIHFAFAQDADLDELKDMLREVDSDGNGEISWEEFLTAMQGIVEPAMAGRNLSQAVAIDAKSTTGVTADDAQQQQQQEAAVAVEGNVDAHASAQEADVAAAEHEDDDQKEEQ